MSQVIHPRSGSRIARRGGHRGAVRIPVQHGTVAKSGDTGGSGHDLLGLPHSTALVMGSIIGVGIFGLPYAIASYGPISLVDDRTAIVFLHSADRREAEAKLVGELQQKGARVISFGGPGDASFAAECDPALMGLACLPSLQLLGERAAQARNIDTVAPRHLTKVVTLA